MRSMSNPLPIAPRRPAGRAFASVLPFGFTAQAHSSALSSLRRSWPLSLDMTRGVAYNYNLSRPPLPFNAVRDTALRSVTEVETW